MLSTLLPTVFPALRDFSPVMAVPPGPCISAENKMIPVYHFDKFVKHAAVFGMEAAKERCFCYSLQSHFQNGLRASLALRVYWRLFCVVWAQLPFRKASGERGPAHRTHTHR